MVVTGEPREVAATDEYHLLVSEAPQEKSSSCSFCPFLHVAGSSATNACAITMCTETGVSREVCKRVIKRAARESQCCVGGWRR